MSHLFDRLASRGFSSDPHRDWLSSLSGAPRWQNQFHSSRNFWHAENPDDAPFPEWFPEVVIASQGSALSDKVRS